MKEDYVNERILSVKIKLKKKEEKNKYFELQQQIDQAERNLMMKDLNRRVGYNENEI